MKAHAQSNIWCLAAALLGALLSSPSVEAAIVIDQRFDDVSAANINSSVVGFGEFARTPAKAQTFTVGLGGTLAGIEINAWNVRPYGNLSRDPLIVEIRKTVSGVPVEDDADLIASVSVDSKHLPNSITDEYGQLNFSYINLLKFKIEVEVGDLLSFVLWTASPASSQPVGYFGIAGSSIPPAYPRGDAFFRTPPPPLGCCNVFTPERDNADWFFRSYVRTVPEPITLALLGVSLAGVAFTRRRKQ